MFTVCYCWFGFMCRFTAGFYEFNVGRWCMLLLSRSYWQ